MLFDRKSKALEAETRLRRHRDRMAGLWAAELLGLIGHAAQDYAREVAHPPRAPGDPPGDSDEARPDTQDDEMVIARLSRDLAGKASVHEIRAKLGHLLTEARRQLGGKGGE